MKKCFWQALFAFLYFATNNKETIKKYIQEREKTDIIMDELSVKDLVSNTNTSCWGRRLVVDSLKKLADRNYAF